MEVKRIEEALIEFIRSEFLFEQEREQLSVDQPLLNEVIDSIGLMRLVVFVEGKFNIVVQDEDLVPENFQNVEKIVEYVQQVLSAK